MNWWTRLKRWFGFGSHIYTVEELKARHELHTEKGMLVTEWDGTVNEVTLHEADAGIWVLVEYADGIVHKVTKEYLYGTMKARYDYW